MRRIVPSALTVKAGLIYRAYVDRAHLFVIDDPQRRLAVPRSGLAPSLPMSVADGDQPPMSAKRDPWLAMAAFLAKEAEALKTDPLFAAEVCSAAHRLAIPLPAAVISDRTCFAVARRCSDLVASGQLRQATALLAGHRLAIERWYRLRQGRTCQARVGCRDRISETTFDE